MTRPAYPLTRLWRTTSPLVALTLVVVGFVATALPASAGADPSVTSTTVTSVPANATTPLTGVTIDGFDANADVSVTISTDIGTLSMTADPDLELEYGNSWSDTSSISFWGPPQDAVVALASLALTTGADTGVAHVAVTGMPRADGYVYSPSNGHFYHYVADSTITWNDARDAAKELTSRGQSGYLATMNTAALNDLVSNRIADANNVFFGASATNTPDEPVQRTWAWDDGPLAGEPISYCTNLYGACAHTDDSSIYTSWEDGEPNNYVWANGEWVGLTNVGGHQGKWNDVRGDAAGYSGYLVEYGDQINGSSGFDDVYTDSSSVRIARAIAAPSSVTAEPGNHSASVSFVPGDDGGAQVTGYRVTASPGGATAECSDSPCVVTGLTNGTAYTFSVVALAGDESSPPSESSAAVTPFAPSGKPGAPTRLALKAGDRTLRITFAAPTSDGGSRITKYQYSRDNGRTWHKVTTRRPLHAVATGVLNGARYTVLVRAVNANGAGPTTRASVRTPAWFTDPVSPSAHKREIAVPKHPKKYHGPRRHTRANARSHAGKIAVPVKSLKARQLQRGQAVTLGGNGIFRFDSAKVTKAGRSHIKAMAKSLRYVGAVTCEGYADYGGTTSNEKKLAKKRSKAVCALVRRYAKHVKTRQVSYGPKRPVVVGGKPSSRAENRRVVVVMR